MDNRFDMQLASTELFDGKGWEFVSDSYEVIGNNGTYTLNGLISSPQSRPGPFPG